MLHFSKVKIAAILAVVFLGMLFAAPNLFRAVTINAETGQVIPKSELRQARKDDVPLRVKLPGWPEPLPQKQVHLGLDLQGGSHLLVEMETAELIEPLLSAIRQDVRNALGKGKKGEKRIYHRVAVNKVKGEVIVKLIKRRNETRSLAELTDAAMQRLKTIQRPLDASSLFAAGGGNNVEITRVKDGEIVIKPSAPAINQRLAGALSSAIETIRLRIDALGTTEPTIQRQGQNRILVQVPGYDDPERLKELIKSTAKLTFHLPYRGMTAQEAEVKGVPPGAILIPHRKDKDLPPNYKLLLQKRPIVEGVDLVDAQPGFDARNGQPIVTFRFNNKGARAFAKVTKANVKRPFAIVLDNGVDKETGKRLIEVISAPIIQEPILGGSGQISGNFTVEETNDLAILLRSGSLPASITIIEERTVGASLGADSIAAGKIAGIIGLGAVIGFILLAYGLFGVFSTIALLVNMTLLVAALSMLQATLTLPGIAGIVLTIGMAVDANVLIFERIREELRAGKTPIAAIDAGYSRALGTILDANITTLIAAIILFWLGSGPVRGFAVTLSIGIVTSVFTAFTLTRLMIALWLRKQQGQGAKRTVELPI